MFKGFMGIVLLASAWGFAPSVALAAATLKEQHVIDFITQEVMRRQQLSRQDVSVSWQGVSLSSMLPTLPDGHVTLDIAATARLGGRGNVPIQVLVDGKKVRTIFPRLDVNIFQTVLVSKGRIEHGTQPAENQVELKRQAINVLNGQPLTSPDQLAGAEALRDIPAGTVLTSQLFKVSPIVKVGQVVTVELKSGGLTLVTTGEAKSAGAKGQVIKVLNLESKREFTARVVAPGRVEINQEVEE